MTHGATKQPGCLSALRLSFCHVVIHLPATAGNIAVLLHKYVRCFGKRAIYIEEQSSEAMGIRDSMLGYWLAQLLAVVDSKAAVLVCS